MDLLREVPYNPEKNHFKPKRIQYLPVHSDVMDIIEMQVAGNTVELVNFT